ncbi:TetR/AcrR family transcriptional regulator [Leuconostoc falkenbergense]|uniref:TetR/AcrR family transcriptional regulator n=1 Tax=Leuconostoc falkenbergense TaxID=2766470 RepID=UPI0024A9874E|nr:TetR/AcrR family transcriptional regulator [Leuconostoc falkenbergense]MDI6554182.1 TetR/AcrR family transcriptional regulator [Leuconostoc falkenbergense]
MPEIKDLRTIKTLHTIENSLMQLLFKKKFKNITIDEIAKMAVINRSTFYLHYHDKYDLLDDLVNKKIKMVIDTIQDEPHITDGNLDYQMFSNDLELSLKVIASEQHFYLFMLNDEEALGIRKKIEDALFDKLSESFPTQTVVERDLLLTIISTIYVSVITWWLNKNMVYSTQYMADQLVKFFKLGTVNIIDPS